MRESGTSVCIDMRPCRARRTRSSAADRANRRDAVAPSHNFVRRGDVRSCIGALWSRTGYRCLEDRYAMPSRMWQTLGRTYNDRCACRVHRSTCRDLSYQHRFQRHLHWCQVSAVIRDRTVPHCGVWRPACGLTRAVAGSPFCCCCTAWARPATCGGGGGRCWPGGGQGAGWHRTCPVTAGRCRYRTTPLSPWPLRSPTLWAPRPAPWCWDTRWAGWSAWPWPAPGSRCECRRSSAWGSRSAGPKTSWTVREPWRTGHRPGSPRVTRRPPATCASRAWPGLVDAAGPAVDAGLREQDGRWRLAMDPGAFAVGAPDMPQLLARSRAAVSLARGEHDAMNTGEQLTRLGVPTITLPGLGHNAHVENPHLASTLLDPHRYTIDQPA